ncbi:MAG: hypothetical protein ISR65_02500 [Bacteriovoracaceae bacterium]|nr:hypothetical protein [Bacteriovoracaceae bacterium]
MKIIIIFISVLILSCDVDRQFEKNNFDTTNLNLTQQNHPYGYAKKECFYCHVRSNIHQQNTLGTDLLDAARGYTMIGDVTRCKDCHGDNGL